MPAYGFTFPNLEHLDCLKLIGGATWPAIRTSFRRPSGVSPNFARTDDALNIPLVMSQGWVEVRRGSSHCDATFFSNDVALHELLHPNLQLVVTTVAGWLNLAALHAAAVVIDGKLWAILGDRGAGKSSFLAYCRSRHDLDVFTDDLLVIRGTSACAGIRMIGLRFDAHRVCSAGNVPYISLPATQAERQIAGWVSLSWSDEFHCRRLSEKQLAYEISRHRLAGDPQRFVDLPGWKVARPREWSSNEALLTAMSSLRQLGA